MKISMKDFGLLLLLAMIWGSSFILMKIGLFGPLGLSNEKAPIINNGFQVGALRIAFAGLFLLPVAFRALKDTTRSDWKWLMLVGTLGNFFPALLFCQAEVKLASSYAGMLNSVTPIFAFIIGIFFFKGEYSAKKIIGLGIGLIGAIALISQKEGDGAFDFASSMMCVLATLMYGISLNIIKHKLSHISSMRIAALSLGFVAIVSIILLIFIWKPSHTLAQEGGIESILSMVVLGTIGTAIALVIFNKMIKRTNVTFASSVTYVIPIFAMIWGLLFHETITFYHLFFSLIILAGVYLITRS